MSKDVLSVYIRWMIRRDMPEVLAIENSSFEYPWDEEDFIRCLRQRNCIGMVAEHNETVVGYMIYELYANRIHLLNIAVHPDYRFKGIGKNIIEKLVSKLSPQRRSKIEAEVRESNLDAQLFFKKMKFRATEIFQQYFENAENAYAMRYKYDEMQAQLQGFQLECSTEESYQKKSSSNLS